LNSDPLTNDLNVERGRGETRRWSVWLKLVPAQKVMLVG
jgi:hypothetical protein